MKITINTNDILGDETTIRKEVISEISTALKQEMRRDAQSLIRETFEKALVETVKEKVAEIVNTHLDTEFTKTNTFGKVGKTTTVRNKIADILANQCIFKKTRYSSDRNAFTSAIMQTVEDEMKKFRKEFNSLITKKVIQECMDEAALKLKAACGIKK